MANSNVQKDSAPEPALSPATQQKILLYFAAHNLRLRYKQIIQDRDYLSQMDQFNFQDEHREYFEVIRKKISSPVEKVEDLNKDVESSPADSMQTYQDLQDQWHNFRLAIEQRMVFKYRNFLSKVDIIVRDCFYALRGVETLTGISLRNPLPLTMLKVGTTYSSHTDEKALVPLIIIPFDRLDIPWNLCAIHHEVGHELFHRLTNASASEQMGDAPDLPVNFKENVKTKLDEQNPDTAAVYQFLNVIATKKLKLANKNGKDLCLDWLEEIFADMVGVMLAGPAYINSLQEILLRENVFTNFSTDYPSTYFRILLNVIFAKEKLGYKVKAKSLLSRWQMLYEEDRHIEALRKEAEKWDPQFKFISDQLTSARVYTWIRHLVNACWEAGIVLSRQENPGKARDYISLSKIYERIKISEYEDLFDNKWEFRDEHLTREQQARLKKTIMTQYINDAKKALFKLGRADYRYPRYLVSALRLAYEDRLVHQPEKTVNQLVETVSQAEKTESNNNQVDWVDWEEKLSRCFLDSVNEPANVANHFRR